MTITRMTPPTHARQPEPALTGAKLALVAAGATLVTLILLAYAAASSYISLWHLGARYRVPLPMLLPVGLDGGLVGMALLSAGFTWAGHPLPMLRACARLFGAGTVAANAAAGWPSPIAMGLRVFAPALLVIISEAVHTVLLARHLEHRDPVPAARWLLAPWPTFLLWRRMVLWRVNSYADAVDMEISRRRAIRALASHYRGRNWRKAAPADIVWALSRGVRLPETLTAVETLTARKPAATTPPSPASDRSREHPRASGRERETGTGELTTEARALAIWMASPAITGAELGVTATRGRQLLRKFRNQVPAGNGD